MKKVGVLYVYVDYVVQDPRNKKHYSPSIGIYFKNFVYFGPPMEVMNSQINEAVFGSEGPP